MIRTELVNRWRRIRDMYYGEKLAVWCSACQSHSDEPKTDYDAVSDGWRLELYRGAHGDIVRRWTCEACMQKGIT